jgi:hypothetical protein
MARTRETSERSEAVDYPAGMSDAPAAVELRIPSGVLVDNAPVPGGVIHLQPATIPPGGVFTPARAGTLDEALTRIAEVTSRNRIGCVPRKSDYRARWRYNTEEFDEA